MNTLNIIVPIYNDAECVEPFYKECERCLEAIGDDVEWYLMFVEDASRDDTMGEVKKLEALYGKNKIKYIANTRRFGKDASIYAGLCNSDADYTVVMDCDLQDPPSLIPDMIVAIEKEGYDCCATYRKDRKGEPLLRSAFSKLFYSLMNKSGAVKLQQGARDFRLMNRKYLAAVLSLCERERFTKGIFAWVGFKTKWIPFENIERQTGTTNMSFKSLYADAIGAIIAFSVAPLRAAIMLGAVITALDLIYIIIALLQIIIFGAAGSGFNIIVGCIAMFGGIIIFMLGMIGEYLSRIYFEVKRRPLYIIKESNIDNIKEIGDF